MSSLAPKSDARTRAHSEGSREIDSAAPVDFARSAVECDESSHRFHRLDVTVLRTAWTAELVMLSLVFICVHSWLALTPGPQQLDDATHLRYRRAWQPYARSLPAIAFGNADEIGKTLV